MAVVIYLFAWFVVGRRKSGTSFESLAYSSWYSARDSSRLDSTRFHSMMQVEFGDELEINDDTVC